MNAFEDVADYSADAELSTAPTDDALAGVRSLAMRMVSLEGEMQAKEEEYNKLKEEYRRISESELPDAMRRIGMESFRLLGGRVVEIAKHIIANINKTQEPFAFNWFRDHGHGDIIKHVVSIPFGRGEDTNADLVVRTLREQFPGLDVEDREQIHPQTLKAFAREQFLEKGATPPESIYMEVRTVATIKQKKSSLR